MGNGFSLGMLKKILKALIPALLTGCLFYILVALTQGMENISQVSGAWFWIGFVIFEALFVLVSKGEYILGRFFKYMAYELWAMPIMMIIYSIVSIGQAGQKTGFWGGLGAGLGGTIAVIIAVIIGGFGGLILFLIGNSINKHRKS